MLKPTQSITYLGYEINTAGTFPIIKADKGRITRIKRQIRCVLKQGAGLCVSVAWAVSPGKLFLRHLYRLLATKNSWNDTLRLNADCTEELNWWLSAVDNWNLKEVRPQPIDVQIETDASHLGWGAALGKLKAKGDWNKRISCHKVGLLVNGIIW